MPTGCCGEPPIRDQGRLYDMVETLVAIAQERGVTPASVALAWLLGRPGVCTLVIGVRSEEQVALVEAKPTSRPNCSA